MIIFLLIVIVLAIIWPEQMGTLFAIIAFICVVGGVALFLGSLA